jgi:ribosomal protein S18 acetylase RimI-like enzyme
MFARIAEDVFDHAVDGQVLAAFLATPGHHLIVALNGDTIVGQVAAMVHRHPDRRPTELYIDEVGVAPAFQRRGIARALLDAMLALGRSLGCAEAWVGTEHDNLPAKALYAARGATPEAFAMYVVKL